jgi:LPXTG-site transpeptidase (sortase) family protein
VASGQGQGKKQRVNPATTVAGLLVVGAGAMAWFGMSSSGPEEPHGPAKTIAASEDTATRLASGPLALGILPTRIVVPAAGIDAPIVEVGVIDDGGSPAWETAWRAAGHHLDSARPGQPGNMVITGHVSVADRKNLAVFRTLDAVAEGDIVEVHAGEAVYRYQVDHVGMVAPSAVNLLRSDNVAKLTLITCTKDLKQRLVVTGRLI